MLERAYVDWPPDRFYFLSPDGEDWLEVTAESFHRAPDHEEDVVRQLEDQLAGKDGTSRLRWARRALGRGEDRTVTFVD